MLRNLWIVIDSIPLVIRMQLGRTYLIPVLLYGCKIFANCDCDDNRELKLAFNNIARYVFHKGHRDHISHLAYQILSIKLDNLLIVSRNIRNTNFVLLNLLDPTGVKIFIRQRFKILLSQRQFFIPTTRLWNSLPNYIQNLGNVNAFIKGLFKLFS